MDEQQILSKQCNHCGRVIKSLYAKQLEYNFNLHEQQCTSKPRDDDQPKGGQDV